MLSDTQSESPTHRREADDFATERQHTEETERNSREQMFIANRKYTLTATEISTAVSDTASPRLMWPSSTIAHGRRFITIVAPPPPPAEETIKSETSTPSAKKPSTLFPSVVIPSTTTPTATPPTQTPSQSPTPTSQSKSSTRQPTPPAQSDAPLNSQQDSTTTTATTTSTTTRGSVSTQSLETSLSLVQPSQRPEKQPDSTPVPVSSPPGLSRGAEVGIVIGSIGAQLCNHDIFEIRLANTFKNKNSPGSGHTVRRHLLLLQTQALGQQHLHQPKQELDAAARHLQTVSAAGQQQQEQALAAADESDAADSILCETAADAANGGCAVTRPYCSAGGEDVPTGREAASAASCATVTDWARFKLVYPAALSGGSGFARGLFVFSVGFPVASAKMMCGVCNSVMSRK